VTLHWQGDLFETEQEGYEIKPIPAWDTYYFLQNIHYAKRIPSITHAFGLFENNALVGVITYGTPPSSTLINGICGPEWAEHVLELNRLCLLNNKPHEASRLVAGSFKYLPKPSIIVSFADTSQQHEGIVYQATNFMYTGLSAKFKDPKVKGLEHQHHATYAHGLTNQQVIAKYGEANVTFVDRPRKHRYIMFLGSKTDRRSMARDFRYTALPYPKPRQNP
jgi:hypothetical protein